MTFSCKYNKLGPTDRLRIPKSQINHIENLLNHYNRIVEDNDNEYLIKIQQKIEKGLEKID